MPLDFSHLKNEKNESKEDILYLGDQAKEVFEKSADENMRKKKFLKELVEKMDKESNSIILKELEIEEVGE